MLPGCFVASLVLGLVITTGESSVLGQTGQPEAPRADENPKPDGTNEASKTASEKDDSDAIWHSMSASANNRIRILRAMVGDGAAGDRSSLMVASTALEKRRAVSLLEICSCDRRLFSKS
jgi:hypothetical protein